MMGITSPAPLTDAQVGALLAAVHPAPHRARGAAWARCLAERPFIERLLQQGVRLSKIRRLLQRRRFRRGPSRSPR